MSKDQRIYLKDILERIARIEQTMAAGEAMIRSSYLYQDALIRSFEVIGEIVKRLDPDLTARMPHIAWASYARFRDLLIHQYDKVILDVVLRTAHSDLAPLKQAVESLLDQLNTGIASDDQ